MVMEFHQKHEFSFINLHYHPIPPSHVVMDGNEISGRKWILGDEVAFRLHCNTITTINDH